MSHRSRVRAPQGVFLSRRSFHVTCLHSMPITYAKHGRRRACRYTLNDAVTFEAMHLCNKSPLLSPPKTHTHKELEYTEMKEQMWNPRCQMLVLYDQSLFFGECTRTCRIVAGFPSASQTQNACPAYMSLGQICQSIAPTTMVELAISNAHLFFSSPPAVRIRKR